ncbi:MAG: esterase/lipase family protein [Gammaproteobacteria bacterium]
MNEEVAVLVHGLWVNGLDMGLLRKRLQTAGYRTLRFSYPSVRNTPLENAMDLNVFANRIHAETIHFVGHSLGGIVIRHLFHEYPQQRPGRVVTLGTPHRSSMAAKQLHRTLPGQALLGKSAMEGLLGNVPPWKADHELGSIAGTLRFGLGMVVPDIPRPNDGTIAVEETKFKGMKDHVTVAASHFGLLLSRRVANQSRYFLQHGRFME